MTAATKKKLETLQSTLNVLEAEQSRKDNLIKYLIVGIGAIAVLVFFFVFIRKRRR